MPSYETRQELFYGATAQLQKLYLAKREEQIPRNKSNMK
jgi:hypothetical protein